MVVVGLMDVGFSGAGFWRFRTQVLWVMLLRATARIEVDKVEEDIMCRVEWLFVAVCVMWIYGDLFGGFGDVGYPSGSTEGRWGQCHESWYIKRRSLGG